MVQQHHVLSALKLLIYRQYAQYESFGRMYYITVIYFAMYALVYLTYNNNIYNKGFTLPITLVHIYLVEQKVQLGYDREPSTSICV